MKLIKNDNPFTGEFELEYLIKESHVCPDDYYNVSINLRDKSYAITKAEEGFDDEIEICEAYMTPEENIEIAKKIQKVFNLYSIGPGWFSITASGKYDTYYNYLEVLKKEIDKLDSKEITSLAKKFNLTKKEFLQKIHHFFGSISERDDTIFCEQFNNNKGYWRIAYLKWEDGKKELKNLIEEELERN